MGGKIRSGPDGEKIKGASMKKVKDREKLYNKKVGNLPSEKSMKKILRKSQGKGVNKMDKQPKKPKAAVGVQPVKASEHKMSD